MHENTKIRFKHYHKGNDPEGVVRGHNEYATQAALVDLDTGNIIEEAWCYCSPRDVPSRAKGREVAEGRLLKKLGALPRQRVKKTKAHSSFRTAPASALAELGV